MTGSKYREDQATVCPKKWLYIFIFWITVKNKPIWIVFGTRNLEEILHKWLWTCPPHLKMSPLYNVKWRIHASDRTCISSLKKWIVLKKPVVLSHGNLNFGQAALQQLLKLTIFCASAYFYNQSLELSTILYWNLAHYEVVETGRGRLHRSWLTHTSHFLVASAVYIR